jgi:beta-1,4-mannosyl-glycoprotein beta-1,4-N-acetylglucosaminyltransferase
MLFDCFTFFNELDLLQIRLREMTEIVDRFVLVEATKTFQGNPKPLYFQENKHLFQPFLHKIEHVVVEFPDVLDNELSRKSPAWGREQHQRDAIARGLAHAAASDFVLMGDVDEIVSARILRREIEAWTDDKVLFFMMPMFVGFLDRRSMDPTLEHGEWGLGPRLLRLRHFTTAQKLRNARPFRSKRLRGTRIGSLHTQFVNWITCGIARRPEIVRTAGWHFSSIGTWDDYRSKIEAFAHEECKDWDLYKDEAAFRTHIEATTSQFPLGGLPRYVVENIAYFDARGFIYATERPR